jgi:hypothetical protein
MMRRLGNVTERGTARNLCKNFGQETSRDLGDLIVDGRVILKCILEIFL